MMSMEGVGWGRDDNIFLLKNTHLFLSLDSTPPPSFSATVFWPFFFFFFLCLFHFSSSFFVCLPSLLASVSHLFMPDKDTSVQYPGWCISCLHDRVGGQLCGDKACPFSGVTNSGRVWRKVLESNARSVPRTLYTPITVNAR